MKEKAQTDPKQFIETLPDNLQALGNMQANDGFGTIAERLDYLANLITTMESNFEISNDVAFLISLRDNFNQLAIDNGLEYFVPSAR